MGVVQAVSEGRRQTLEALRNHIAERIDAGVPARDLASLSKRLMDISAELDGVIAAEDGDDIGEAASTSDETWSPTGGAQARTP